VTTLSAPTILTDRQHIWWHYPCLTYWQTDRQTTCDDIICTYHTGRQTDHIWWYYLCRPYWQIDRQTTLPTPTILTDRQHIWWHYLHLPYRQTDRQHTMTLPVPIKPTGRWTTSDGITHTNHTDRQTDSMRWHYLCQPCCQTHWLTTSGNK